MTETEWLTSSDLIPMLKRLNCQGYDRKARLYACACVRRILDCLSDIRSHRAVETLEKQTDGLANSEELHAAHREAGNVGLNAAACLASEEPAIVAFQALADIGASGCDSPRRANEPAAQCHLLRCLFGDPFRPLPPLDPSWLAWNNGLVSKLAQDAYQERSLPSGELDPSHLAVLADALEEVGADSSLVSHLRQPGLHVRGCHVVDLLLVKE